MTTRPEVPADLHYDPYDYETDRNPHPVWKRLRDEAPLYFNEQHGFYALSRYQDVLDGLLDWETYSSARGTVLEIIQPGPAADSPSADGRQPRLDDLQRSTGPRHRAPHRQPLVHAPQGRGSSKARLRRLCRESLDALEGRTEFDFLGEFASRIPPMIIGEMLGVPEEDQEQLGRWADMFMHYDPDAETGDTIQGIMQFNEIRIEGGRQMGAYMADLIEQRRQQRQDDLISLLLDVEVDLPDGTTRRLEPMEVQGFFVLLQSAGSETTARLLGWSAVLLARHPEQRAKLLADRSLLANAVEELLRYEAPSPIQARYVTRDVDLYGVTVPAGSKMALLNGSAGRDEREYPDPDRFDVTRHMDRHMTFGYSTHFCLGAALARLEGAVVIDEMLTRHPEWTVDEDRIEMVHTTTVRGPAHVPVAV